MSMYNMMFGQNPASDMLLEAISLNREQVGRFRDAYLEHYGQDNQLVITIYTRNGGGNRDCWCRNDPKYGQEGCKHHDIKEEVDELEEVKLGGLISYKRTGKRVMATRHVCEEPNSISCACPGCTVNYRLPKHPLYLMDEDEEFDSTYASIRFRIPEEFKPIAELLASGQAKETPKEKWALLLEDLKNKEPKTEIGRKAMETGKKMLAPLVNTLAEKIKDQEIQEN